MYTLRTPAPLQSDLLELIAQASRHASYGEVQAGVMLLEDALARLRSENPASPDVLTLARALCRYRERYATALTLEWRRVGPKLGHLQLALAPDLLA